MRGVSTALYKTSRVLFLVIVISLITSQTAFASKIIIDPGHGGSDPGAIGVNGLEEKLVNLDVSLKVRDLLHKEGFETVMTREDDRYISLADRIRFSNRQDADLLVSIHSNSHPNSSARGGLILYYDSRYPQASYPASPEMIHYSKVSELFAQQVLDKYISITGFQNRGLMDSSVYMVRKGNVPSILVETAFLSNWEDAAILADESKRSIIAQGIAEGIKSYTQIIFPDTVDHWARESIMKMHEKGWLQGYKNYFQPSNALTRAEFVSLMNRVFDFSKLEPIASSQDSSTPVFPDLPQKHWAYEDVMKAAELGLLQGYPDGTIQPDSPITRGETAYLFNLLMNASNETTKATPIFTDVPADLWSSQAIYALQKLGILTGYNKTEFKPNYKMLRSEMAVVLDRYLQTK